MGEIDQQQPLAASITTVQCSGIRNNSSPVSRHYPIPTRTLQTANEPRGL